MTDKHPVPSHGSLICTFADCPDRWWEQEYSIIHLRDLYSCQMGYLDTGCVYLCEKLVSEGKCPRGFQR